MDKKNVFTGGRVFRIAIGLMILALLPAGGAVPVEEWNRTFGGTDNDYAWSVQQTSDSDYILAGTYNYEFGNMYAWLIKTDSNGSEVWNRKFGGTLQDESRDVKQTIDGGYIIAGFTRSYGAGDFDAWLIRTDSNGSEVWNRTFGGTLRDVATSVQQTSDGGYILAGNTISYGAGDYDSWLIKTDSNGIGVWNRTFGGILYDNTPSVQQTSDGGYILAGNTISYGAGDFDAWLIKTDSNGSEVWNRTFGGPLLDGATSIRQTSDGGYIFAGNTISYGAGSNDAWLLKTDSNGFEVWNRTFGGILPDATFYEMQTSDGGYILTGHTISYGAGSNDAWLIKTDSNGFEVWNRTFGGTFADVTYFVQQTSDAGYILAGNTYSYGAGGHDAWLIKVSTGSRNITVNASGGADYTRIQDAIDNASAGDTILVNRGTYDEYLNINKQLALRGIDDGSGKPVIRYSGWDIGYRPVDISANGVTLEGFNITNAVYRYGANFVININSANNTTIENNTITYNDIGGIGMFFSDNNTIRNNSIIHNNGSGIIFGYLAYDPRNQSCDYNNISDNIIINNTMGISISGYSSNNSFTNNTIDSNGNGIALTGYINNSLAEITVSYNVIIGNNVSYNTRPGIRLRNSSYNTIANNILDNNGRHGINLGQNSNNNVITGNFVRNNALTGFNLSGPSSNNLIYNNLFNNSQNFRTRGANENITWNVSVSSGMNVMGGPNLGGNFWGNPDNMGFSQTCLDAADRDGICDSPFPFDLNNTDYLPLAASEAPSTPSGINGTIFIDSNGNGTMDAEEDGIPNVEVHLIRMISPATEFLVGNMTTDPNGNYSFTGIPGGNYRIEEFPVGSLQTFPADGMPQYVILGAVENRTGINFGNQIISPGEIRGTKFNDSNGNGTQDEGENGIEGVNICIFPWRCVMTNVSGNYNISGLSPGNYTLYEIVPPGYLATTPTMFSITVNEGDAVIVNFGNRLPVPPPEDINVEQQSGEINGVPTVYRPGLSVLTITKNLTNLLENVVSVNLTMNWSDGTSRNASMIQIGATNVWTADFSAPFPGGIAQMRFEVDVAPPGPSELDAIQIGDIIFIDPSGQIKDACTGNSIRDATVTLLVEYPPGSGSFIESPPENQLPEDNPLITGDDGRYRWDTVPGTYKVTAEKAGYDTAESVPVTVPPPATDVDISLSPSGGCGVTLSNSGGGTWHNGKEMTILNPGAALSDYQVLVNLTGANFPIEANTSGSDVRFTDAGGAELAYWIENWDYSNSSALAWVNVTNILASTSTIKMWYGNPSATSSSNIKTTFIDGDDFITDTSSNYQWSEGSGSFYVSNGVLNIEGGNTRARSLVPKVQNPPASYIMEMYAQEDWKHLLGVAGYMDSILNPTQGYSYYMIEYYGDDYFRLSRFDDGIPPFVTISFSPNTWYYFLGRFSPGNISGKWNRAIDGTFTTDSTRTSGYYAITTHLANVKVDWWFVRSYASSEPLVTFTSYNLAGHVLNASSGLGIPGALVKLDYYPQYNATTNLNGDYSMTVPAGTYSVSATAAGYTTNSATVTINADTVHDFSLSPLPPIRFINGTVMDSITKNVLAGVTVSTTDASTASNALGFYSLTVASGTYPLTASYDFTYYANSSVTVSTESSAVVEQDIELVKKPMGNITGSVTKA